MNALELCQRAWEQTGASGAGPSAIASQSGLRADVVRWVQAKYIELLTERPWPFLWAQATVALTAGQAVYDFSTDWAINDAGKVISDQVWLMTTPNKQRLRYRPFFDARDAWETLPDDQPGAFSRRPDQGLQFWPAPSATYSVRLDYYRATHELTDNTDEPLLPQQFHWLLVWLAVEVYAAGREDISLQTKALRESAKIKNDLLTFCGLTPDFTPVPLDAEIVRNAVLLV